MHTKYSERNKRRWADPEQATKMLTTLQRAREALKDERGFDRAVRLHRTRRLKAANRDSRIK